MNKSLILLHGAIGAKDQLEPLAKALSEKDFAVYSFSFSGHGQTPFEPDFGIEQFSKELKDFIQKNNLSKPNVFGYSMGGYAALYLASREKNLLGNIVTLGTKFEWNKEIAEKEIKNLDPEIIEQKVPKFAEALKQRHGNEWKKLLTRTKEMMIGLGGDNLLSKEKFGAIENKVMIGLADKDTMVSATESDSASFLIKNSSRFTFEGAKHRIETVDPAKLAELVTSFLI